MDILIISGLSGGGKSKAASFLEDMGFYIVDNMPAAMILKFAEFCSCGSGRYDRIALVYDVRTTNDPTELPMVMERLRNMETACHLLFLEADAETIIRRYKETRRRHPLAEKCDSLEEAVKAEQAMMAPVRQAADYIIDTSHTSTAQLRGELLRAFGSVEDQKGGLAVSITSFGFKYGLPMEADLVLDVRFMPNPFYIEELRNLTGLDRPVSDYVFSFQQTKDYLEKIEDLLKFTLPLYAEEGKTVLVIAVGCTGGHHRSVAITHTLAEEIRKLGYQVSEQHRDMNRN
ncbi:MAG: RNase adapter RapZ [Oscillibacter sp.]|nr:RNase adapter RapZ [Oscillibacter sp.]